MTAGDGSGAASVEARPTHAEGDVVPVTFVSSHSLLGGAERYLRLLLSEMPAGWVRQVVCLQEGPFADELRAGGYPVEIVKTGPRARDLARSALRLRGVLARSAPSVVHANGVKAAIVAVAATMGTQTPVIWFKHDVSRDGWLANLLARRSASVVAVSATVAETFRGRARRKVEVIRIQMADPSIDRELARQTVLGLFAPEVPDAVVTLVGRLDPHKGHRELLSILPGLRAERDGVRLLFVGGDDSSYPDVGIRLREEIASSEGGAGVLLAGHRHDAIELIAGSDIVVIPSVTGVRGIGREGFSYVALEALAVGTPVVCYSHGALPEVVGDCGVLVAPGDRDALRNAILGLLDDEHRRAELGRRGRERFLARFQLSSLPGEVMDRYARAAARAARQSA